MHARTFASKALEQTVGVIRWQFCLSGETQGTVWDGDIEACLECAEAAEQWIVLNTKNSAARSFR